MREILFRGKRIDNCEWVTGFYVHYDDTKDNHKDDCDYIVGIHTGEHFPFFEVIPETVGQYTGLTDKNGKKIFEGDILTAHFVSNRYKQQFEVIFEKGIFFFDNKCVKVPVWDIYSLKVIGNIHDNPELLKGGDEE